MQVANKTQLKLEQEKGSVCLFKCVFVFCVCDVLLHRAYFSSPYSLSSDRSSKAPPPPPRPSTWKLERGEEKERMDGKERERCDGGEKGWSAKKGRTGEERRQRQPWNGNKTEKN